MAHTMLLSGHSAPACSHRGGCSSSSRPVAVAAALLPQRPTCRAAPASPPAACWLLQLQAARPHPHGARNATLVARSSAAPASDSSSSSSSSEVPDVEQDFDLLSTQVAELSKVVSDEMRGCSIFLVGMMGSGKSTVGKMLANTLRYAFFDTDSMIELAHDKKAVAEIFAEYGQEYFRSCEAQVIKELSPYKNLVVATGGGAVINPENWGYMRQGVVVWLSGDVALLARRVAKDGISKRPLLAADLPKSADGAQPDEGALYDAALGKLRKILDDRQKFYLNADLTVSLEGTGVDAATGAPTAVVMYRLLQGLDARIQRTKQDREERRNFKIEYASDVPTMRTVESPVAQAQQQQQGGAPPPAA